MDDEEKGEHDWKPCSGLKDELLKCLKESACVAEEGKTPRQCLQENRAPDCNSFRYAYFECKRSLLDNRQRFRGKKGY